MQYLLDEKEKSIYDKGLKYDELAKAYSYKMVVLDAWIDTINEFLTGEQKIVFLKLIDKEVKEALVAFQEKQEKQEKKESRRRRLSDTQS